MIKIKNLLSFILGEEIEDETDKQKLLEKVNIILNSEKFKKKEIEAVKNDLHKEIINIRINSIIKTLDMEEYIKKYNKEGYTLYEYSSKIMVYIQNKNENLNSAIISDLNSYNYNHIICFYTVKKNSNTIIKKKKITKEFLNKNFNKLFIYDKILLTNLSHTK